MPYPSYSKIPESCLPKLDMNCAASRHLFRKRASTIDLLAALEGIAPELQESQSDPVGDEGLGVRREASQIEPPHSSRDVPEESHGPEDDNDMLELVRREYPKNADLQRIMDAKRTSQRSNPWTLIHDRGFRIELKDCDIIDDMLFVKKKIYVPEGARTAVLKYVHGSQTGGHAGKHGTYHRTKISYHWPFMTDSVAIYVRNCHICKRSKAFRDGKQGLLHPLAIPDRYWSSVSVNFITPLPLCHKDGKKYKHLMVVVDRVSKMKRSLPLERLETKKWCRLTSTPSGNWKVTPTK